MGATCNPVIVLGVIKKELKVWKERISALTKEFPPQPKMKSRGSWFAKISIQAARLLEPIFKEHKGKNGRLSIQTDPRLFRDSHALVEQALEFSKLAPNMIVKIAATSAGIAAIEEATYRGVSINATVSFTVPQAIAVAEAVERGLKRRESEGWKPRAWAPCARSWWGAWTIG